MLGPTASFWRYFFAKSPPTAILVLETAVAHISAKSFMPERLIVLGSGIASFSTVRKLVTSEWCLLALGLVIYSYVYTLTIRSCYIEFSDPGYSEPLR